MLHSNFQKSLWPSKSLSTLKIQNYLKIFHSTSKICNNVPNLLWTPKLFQKSKRPTSRSQKILKSEVKELDEAFSKILQDEHPQKNVINNLKKKHGLLINSPPSLSVNR